MPLFIMTQNGSANCLVSTITGFYHPEINLWIVFTLQNYTKYSSSLILHIVQ